MYTFMIFYTYSIIGWVWETVYCSFKSKHIVYRGFLLGPYCPVYGFGMIAVLLLVPKQAGTVLNLYLNMIVIVTVIEYLTSWLLEKLFNMRLWDYSNIPLNISGRVAIPVSAFWGIGVLFLYQFIEPLVEHIVIRFIQATHSIGPLLLFLFFIIDVGTTFGFTLMMKDEVAKIIDTSNKENAPIKQYRLEHLFTNRGRDEYTQLIKKTLSKKKHTLKEKNLLRLIYHYPNILFKSNQKFKEAIPMDLRDYGKEAITFNMKDIVLKNENYRTTIWTGDYFQITLMCIPAGGGDIGMEIHPNVDQFLRLESGCGKVEMGEEKDVVTLSKVVKTNDVIIIPANTWHNVTNIGEKPMKLYSIYSPPNHPYGIKEKTKKEALNLES